MQKVKKKKKIKQPKKQQQTSKSPVSKNQVTGLFACTVSPSKQSVAICIQGLLFKHPSLHAGGPAFSSPRSHPARPPVTFLPTVHIFHTRKKAARDTERIVHNKNLLKSDAMSAARPPQIQPKQKSLLFPPSCSSAELKRSNNKSSI